MLRVHSTYSAMLPFNPPGTARLETCTLVCMDDSTMRSELSHCRRSYPVGTQTIVNRTPIDIGKKGFNVFWAIRWSVIENESMFPHIHDENRDKAGDVSNFMQGDPVIRQDAVLRVLVTNRPTDASHLAN